MSDRDIIVPAADRATQPGEPGQNAELSGDLVGARPAEPPALLLARARVGGALFGAAVGLGRFRVLERLGGGGMGVVYAAYDPALDRGVALKTVHVPHVGRDPALREAKALARLAHPNVVPVFDVGLEGEHVYIVMELVRGPTLRNWVNGRTQREILEVYRQAGQALAAAHDVGLVHRDFKPDNAIVGTDGRVRVVDFGLACEAATETTAVAAPRAAGTPRYMAPEYALHAWLAPATAECWVELADLRSELDDRSAAVAALDRALALGAGTNANTPEAVGYRELWRGDASAAARAFEAALEELAPRTGEPWYRAFARARVSLGLGRALVALDQPAAAAAELERSIADLAPIARDQHAVAIDRRLGRARAALAHARAAMGAPREATRAIAAAALAWLGSAGAPAGEITALQRLVDLP